MKKKLFSILLAVIMLSAFFVPAASAASTTLVALNPLGDIDIQANIPLSSRDKFYDADGNLDLNGKLIGLSAYSKSNNVQALQALGELLIAEFPGLMVVYSGVTDLSSPWNNKTDANYNQWAGLTNIPATTAKLGGGNIGTARPLDAVIFGVAD